MPILARFDISYEGAQEFISALNRIFGHTNKRYFISDSTLYRYMVIYRKLASEAILNRIQDGSLFGIRFDGKDDYWLVSDVILSRFWVKTCSFRSFLVRKVQL